MASSGVVGQHLINRPRYGPLKLWYWLPNNHELCLARREMRAMVCEELRAQWSRLRWGAVGSSRPSTWVQSFATLLNAAGNPLAVLTRLSNAKGALTMRATPNFPLRICHFARVQSAGSSVACRQKPSGKPL